jgi:hypothetical protein
LINSGLFAGNYFAAGYNYTDPDPANSVYSGALFTVSPSGASNIVYQAPGTATTATGGEFGTPIVAPNGFGQIGGEILVPQLISNAIQLVTPTSATSASLSTFAALPIAPFGLLFAPAGFGSAGGDLLVSGYEPGTIPLQRWRKAKSDCARWPSRQQDSEPTAVTYSSALAQVPAEAASMALSMSSIPRASWLLY